MTTLLGDQLVTIRAVEEIRAAYRGSLDAERWYTLWLEATGDENLADRARAQFLLAQIRAGALTE